MLANFFIVALRNIWKNRVVNLLNLFGLSLAVGVSIISFLLFDQMVNMDKMHKKGDRIYLVGNSINISGKLENWGDSPALLGEALKSEIPQIEEAVRVHPQGMYLRLGEQYVLENIQFVDEGFFDVFSFKMLMGTPEALEDPNSALISDSYAKKYFGDKNPVGQEIVMTKSPGSTTTLIVNGVYEDPGFFSSLDFDVLVSIKKLESEDLVHFEKWNQWTRATFILLKENSSIDDVIPLSQKFVENQNASSKNWQVDSWCFIPFLDAARNADKYENILIQGIPIVAIVTFVALALFLLLLACSNYTNNTLVNTTKRFHEIGLRKVVGGNSTQIMIQHIGENFIFLLFAMLCGLVLAEILLIPGWNKIIDNGALDMNYVANYRLWIYLLGLLLTTGFITGLYPAWIATRFQAVEIFRHNSFKTGNGKFIKSLIAFQFVITLLFLIFTFGIYQNTRYQIDKDWGYDKEDVVVVVLPETKYYENFITEVKAVPGVLDYSGAYGHFGRREALTGITIEGQDFRVQSISGDANYPHLLGIKIKDGSLFDKDQTYASRNMLVNQTFVDKVGWENPLEQKITLKNESYNITGVVEDFHTTSFMNEIQPVMIRIAEPEKYQTILIKCRSGNTIEIENQAKQIWKRIIPDVPYAGYLQRESFDFLDKLNNQILTVFRFSGVSALLISIMGIIGIVSSTLIKRQREIAIRKVMGARINQIITLIAKPFVLLFIFASVISSAAGWYAFNLFLEKTYAYHINSSPALILLSFGSMLLVILITLIVQTIGAAFSNPADILRDN